jgi:hypothetical protein
MTTATSPRQWTWPDIFGLFQAPGAACAAVWQRDMARALGAELGMVRQWHKRGPSVPIQYWPRLIAVLAERYGVHLDCNDLVAITLAEDRKMQLRLPKSQDAA